ncbi:MAG: sugar phosphate isomerase/epimerase [Clostridia bacterium]|nr:sugar phosphate isomerase/epimerase [Clostridia bacterium]
MKIEFRTHDLGVRGLEPAVSKVKECGIDGVQLVAYKFMDELKYQPGQLNEENSRWIGDTLRSNGIDVGLIGAYFNPVHSNPEKVKNGIAVFKEYLKYCNNLGCNIVGSETGSFNDDKWTYNPLNRTEEALERVTATFKDLAIYAGKLGVNIGMEGAAGHVCYDVKTLKRAIDGINQPNVKVIFDIYNYLDSSNHASYLDILDEGLETFAGKICVFHIKDYVFDEAENKVKQVPPGKGVFDFDAILKRIKAYDKDAKLVLEGTTGENIVPCSQFLREKWNEV